ncbi:RidA family protein [Brevibacillus sp. TJ4]|uniref:RidA family protein n=1 Tax=Brevibacillus sp. TJ4 TaxID=3234853 RepID=UPI003BA2C877
MNISILSTDKAPAAIGPYSQAVKAGPFLFASGQIPLRPDGSLVEGDIEEQTRQVLANIKGLLEEAGATPSSIVKTTVFLADMNDFAKMNDVYSTVFSEHKPARSTVQVARLPRDVKVEIEFVAYLEG